MSPRVYVTGMGVVSALGLGRRDFWASLLAGRSGASADESFDASGLDRSVAAEAKVFRARDHLTARELRDAGRCSAMAIAAARMAVADAGLAPDALRDEKKRLQAFLRAFEKDFAEKHGRAVKFVKDIEPVVDSYKRYKALKAALAGVAADA